MRRCAGHIGQARCQLKMQMGLPATIHVRRAKKGNLLAARHHIAGAKMADAVRVEMPIKGEESGAVPIRMFKYQNAAIIQMPRTIYSCNHMTIQRRKNAVAGRCKQINPQMHATPPLDRGWRGQECGFGVDQTRLKIMTDMNIRAVQRRRDQRNRLSIGDARRISRIDRISDGAGT